MLSVDTNILFYAYNQATAKHTAAYDWLASLANRDDVAISEMVLVELYCLLRNPTVLRAPLQAREAVQVIQTYRQQPSWRIIGFPSDSAAIHSELWDHASHRAFAYRRIYDARLALCLWEHGVREFATCNIRDFQGFGFGRVWDPL